ncbi:unnamed protein product [Danaus chrysippus]|uniref:(African queen) hypothetical protein n=1 Tax=Danaus chrysippus TaxID=151541 RepID=A0A8J2VTK6_9NEOP|nr:unnamed protein product [Danaus chrysippus]
MDRVLRASRAVKRPVMWALPVLRTRSYLGTVEFYAHAASSGSLGPRDLYSVNLRSVFRCKTFIRTASAQHSYNQHRRESEKDGRRSPAPWLKVFVECVICIERWVGGGGCGVRSEAVAAPIDSWGYSSSGHCCSSYVPGEPVFSYHRTARHTLVKPVPTREVATNKLLFFTALEHARTHSEY